MDFTVRVERAGKTVFNKTIKNLMHHEGMYQGILSVADARPLVLLGLPDHFAWISAGTWTSATRLGTGLTEFTSYTVDGGGGNRATSTAPNPAVIAPVDGDPDRVSLLVKTTQVIEVTAPGTITGLCLTRDAPKGTIQEMYFSIELSLPVQIGDFLSIKHRIVAEIRSDLHPN